MKTKKSFLVVISLVLSTILTLSGFTYSRTTKTSEKTVLKMMDVGGSADFAVVNIINNIINKFNKENKFNATVEVTFVENEQFKTKFATMMAANTPPDIFFTWEEGYLKPFVDAGKVYNIGQAIDKDSEWKNRFINGILNPLTVNGKVYAVPSVQAACPLYYNTEIFKKYNLKVPRTITELNSVIAVLNKNGITPFAFGCKASWVAGEFLQNLSNQTGGMELFNNIQNGKTTWEDPDFIKAGNILDELVKANAFPKGFLGLDYDPALDLFKQGKAAMLYMGSWATSAVTDPQNPIHNKVGVAKFPAVIGGKGNGNVWVASVDRSYAISQSCPDKKAAAAFLKMFADDVFQKQFAENAKVVIATKTKLDAKKLDPSLVKIIDLEKDLKGMTPWYDRVFGAGVGGEFNNAAQSIMAGKDVKKAFKDLQQYTKDNADE